MEAARILVVEDDPMLGALILDYLRENGMVGSIEERGDRAIERILNESPDAVLLDVNLPGCDGFEVCRQVRERYHGPILMMTARDGEVDEIFGLAIGADDYLSKPVRPRVLLARLQSQLRKVPNTGAASQPIVQAGSFRIDPGTREVRRNGVELELTTAEFELLYLLASKPGVILSRSDIYQSLHGMRYDGLDRSVDLRVSRLRKKLGDDPEKPKIILSVRGTGYQLNTDPV